MHQNSKVLIFGSNGQDGYYLENLLRNEKIDVRGISRKNSLTLGNVGNFELVKKQIAEYKPSYIFHFAANSTTSHNALLENHHSICDGTLNILESVRLLCPETKVFISGSAMQFENIGLPINEKTPFDPSSAYSVARIQSVYASRYFRKKFGLKIFVGYFFNHDSPRRTEKHVNQKIVQAVKRINAGSSEKLELGNIKVKKEFNFAGDIVNAAWILINQDKIFEAVLGCGEAYSIEEWLEYCFKKINKKWEDHVVLKTDHIDEYNILISDPVILKSLGWKPNVNFHQLADIMMESINTLY